MKKIIISLTAFVISITQTSIIKAYSKEECAEESVDMEELFEEAKNNSDDKIESVLENEAGTETYTLETYVINEENSETYITAIPSALFEGDYAIEPCSSGSKSDSAYDDSYSVYAKISINYNTTSSNGRTGYLLKSVTGSWQIKDSSVTLSNRNIIYACTGLTLNGSYNLNQYVEKNISSNSFSYNTGFSSYVINDSGYSLGTMGATSSVTLKHGSSSTWNLTINAKAF